MSNTFVSEKHKELEAELSGIEKNLAQLAQLKAELQNTSGELQRANEATINSANRASRQFRELANIDRDLAHALRQKTKPRLFRRDRSPENQIQSLQSSRASQLEACQAAEEEKQRAALHKQELTEKISQLRAVLSSQQDLNRSELNDRKDELRKEIEAEVNRHLENRLSQRGNILKKARQVLDWSNDLDIGDPEL